MLVLFASEMLYNDLYNACLGLNPFKSQMFSPFGGDIPIFVAEIMKQILCLLFKVFGSQNFIGNPKTSNTLEKMNQHADFDGSTLRSNPKVCSFRYLRSKLESSRPQRSTRACRWSRIRMISSHERVGGPSAVCGDVVDPLQLMVGWLEVHDWRVFWHIIAKIGGLKLMNICENTSILFPLMVPKNRGGMKGWQCSINLRSRIVDGFAVTVR